MATVWRHISQSVQGVHHSAEGTACQDSCSARVLGDGPDSALVACVADGAGDSRHSDIGSRLACESIIESAAAQFEATRSFAGLSDDDILRWCEVARRKISDHAESSERSLRQYATTLCAAFVSARGSVFLQIGDGAIVARRNDVFGAVFWPQSGEYVNTTNFLTSQEFREHVQIYVTADVFTDLALLTDGMERLALRFDSLTPHPPFFQPLFYALRAATDLDGLGEDLRRFLQSDAVLKKTDDDKTLVLASRVFD
jgi:serine/threonine protein phosphatase PrpC